MGKKEKKNGGEPCCPPLAVEAVAAHSVIRSAAAALTHQLEALDVRLTMTAATQTFDIAGDDAVDESALPDDKLLGATGTQVFDDAEGFGSPSAHDAPPGDQHLDDSLGKQTQDDTVTPGAFAAQRSSWHDVADDDLDFGNFRFLSGARPCSVVSTSPGAFEATGVEKPCIGHAAFNSQELGTQCGNSRHVNDILDVDGSSPMTPRQCVMPRFNHHFAEHARAVLSDVFGGLSGSDPEESCSNTGGVEDDAVPLPLRGTGSPGTSPGGGQGDGAMKSDGFQCTFAGTQSSPGNTGSGDSFAGPCAMSGYTGIAGSLDETNPALTVGSSDDPDLVDDLDYFFPNGGSIFDGDTLAAITEDVAPQDFSTPTSQTQCGPLPHEHDTSDSLAGKAACSHVDDKHEVPSTQTSRTQCGPLPHQHMQQAPCARGKSDAALSSEPSPKSTLEALERLFLTIDPGPLKDTFVSFLPTHRQYVEDLCFSAQTSRTQCGPLPHAHDTSDTLAGNAAYNHDDGKHEVFSTQTSRTQCGPLPHAHFTSDSLAGKAAYSHDDDKHEVPGTQTSRTQCGPLPHEHMQQAPCALGKSAAASSFGPSPQQLAFERSMKHAVDKPRFPKQRRGLKNT